MAKFRHHPSTRVVETLNDEKIAELDADELYQRLDEDDDTPAQNLDDTAAASRSRKA